MKKLPILSFLLLISCGDDDSPGLECSPGEFRLSGDVDGVGVSRMETYRSLVLFNIRESSINVSSTAGTSVSLFWTGSVPNDQESSFDSGAVAVMQNAEAPLLDGLCSTEGTFVLVRDGVRAELGGLKQGDCETGTPVSGSLKFCTEKSQ